MRQRVTLLVIAAAGLALGIVGAAIHLAALGVAAGGIALIVGLIAFSEPNVATSSNEMTLLENELSATRHELSLTKHSLEISQQEHDETRKTLADYMVAQPGAGSFDRKLTETAGPGDADASQVNPTDTRLLADPETNLFSEAYFRVALDARIASARRHLRPVAVALVEVVEGSGALGSGTADAVKVTGSIRQTLRDADTACRMSDGCFALILEDTPENGAVWTVERIRRNLNSRHGQHTMWAGVACYPAHAFSTDELLDQASLALESAREWKQDRIEVATAE